MLYKNSNFCKIPIYWDCWGTLLKVNLHLEMDKTRYICNGNCGQCRYARGSEYCNPEEQESRFAYGIDRILTNRWLGLPILFLVLFGIFELTFTIGAYPQRLIEAGVDSLAILIKNRFGTGWFPSLVADGIVEGCGAVVAFLPNIFLLFLFLSLLEDSGYMARAAFLMDKLMHRIGLHGNSFVPMILGFGCNVPAIMATRSISNLKDRRLTMLMIPFMSCSARLPVYLLLASAFFPKYRALVMISMYLAGILFSILFAIVMKNTKWFRKAETDDVFALPKLCWPAAGNLWGHVWERCKDYLQKITTVILAASVVIWALEYFPTVDGKPAAEDSSCLAAIGRWMEPVMKPIGFDWKMNVCVLTGLPAKEAIVSTMGILYRRDGNQSLEAALRQSGSFDAASAISFLLFVLLYFPCIATVRTLRLQAGRKWALFSVVHSLALAWIVAFLANTLVSALL